MSDNLPKTFQMRFDLKNEQDLKIAIFLQEYPWSKTQKVKEILLMYIQGDIAPSGVFKKDQAHRETSVEV